MFHSTRNNTSVLSSKVDVALVACMFRLKTRTFGQQCLSLTCACSVFLQRAEAARASLEVGSQSSV